MNPQNHFNNRRVIHIRLLWVLVLAIAGGGGLVRAQLSSQTTTNGVLSDILPAKLPLPPIGLTNVPSARIQIDADSAYQRSLESMLLSYLGAAKRPRLTEAANSDVVVKAILVNPPEIDLVKANGFFHRAGKIWKNVGDTVLPFTLESARDKAEQLWEKIDIQQTNLQVAIRCKVELRLLSSTGDYLAQNAVEVIQTNTYKALSVALNDFRLGATPEQGAGSFSASLKRKTALESLANFTLYQAVVQWLPSVDNQFLKMQSSSTATVQASARPESKPESRPESKSTPSVGPGEWMTVSETADYLKITEEQVLKAIANGEIKAKMFVGQWRIIRSSL